MSRRVIFDIFGDLADVGFAPDADRKSDLPAACRDGHRRSIYARRRVVMLGWHTNCLTVAMLRINWRIAMPTTLPVRPNVRHENAGRKDLYALGLFYVVVGLAMLLLFVSENHFGMFEGLTATQSVLKATANKYGTDEPGVIWAAAGSGF
jgi:hypothetical protein